MKTQPMLASANLAIRYFVALLATWLAMSAKHASANVTVQLGEQDFADAVGVNGVAAFNPTAVGEPAPFDQFRGSDLAGFAPFSESWTFNFAAGSYVDATLTLGIADHDSQATGSQIAFFGFDGNDLTSLLDAQFESHGGRQFENNIYMVDLPALALNDLSDGSATFTLTLQGPSLGGAPLTPTPEILPNNGAGLDFAQLDLTVPEPGSSTLLLVSIASLAAASRQRRS